MTNIVLMMALLASHHITTTKAEKLDVVIFLDGSSTICDAQPCPNWDYILQFVYDIVEHLTIGPDDSLVSLGVVGDQPQMLWGFNKYTDKASLLSAIKNVVFPGGELPVAVPFEYGIHKVYTPAAGVRPGARNVVIGITDGAPKIDASAEYDVSTKFQFKGVKVFVVCITNRCSESFAKGLSSPPKKVDETYFLVEDFSSLELVVPKLLKKMAPQLKLE